MEAQRRLRGLVGMLGVHDEELVSLIDAVEKLFFITPETPADIGRPTRQPGPRSQPARALVELRESRDLIFEQTGQLHEALNTHFGRVPPVNAIVTDVGPSEPTVLHRILDEISDKSPRLPMHLEFQDVLNMPGLAENLLETARRLPQELPAAGVLDRSRSVQVGWVIGRSGRSILAHHTPLRKAALRRYPHLAEVVPLDEEIRRLDVEVGKRLKELGEQGLYVLPEPPLLPEAAPERPREAQILRLDTINDKRPGVTGGRGNRSRRPGPRR